MKNFNILSLLVMIVLMCSASLMASHTTPKAQLREIREEAHNMSNKKHWNLTVPRVSGNKTCVNHFFCLAGKSLNSTTDFINSKLVRLINQYNEMKKDTHCNLTLSSTYRVERLLGDICTCAKIGILSGKRSDDMSYSE